MEKKEAKELSLEVWRYLRDHPECKKKDQMPSELYDKVKNLHGECPLCEVFIRQMPRNTPGRCGCNEKETSQCPLALAGEWCFAGGCTFSIFQKWSYADRYSRRSEAAARIVEIIEGWDLKGEA